MKTRNAEASTRPDTTSRAANPPADPSTPFSIPTPARLADYTADLRILPLSAMAVVIGVLSAFVALGLLRLIGLFTNLFFFQRASTELVTPAGHTLGPWIIAIPALGGLLVGLMARFGSEKIRGHGIPEAIEAILLRKAKVEPKLAVLKPISAAIAIGSGGPFGAEGPIIMTGGAFGSLIAQFFHLSASERKTLLVAGAAGGMAAVFATPVAAVLLAAELLLFEWKPRSLIPVALASATAMGVRLVLLGAPPLFHVPPHTGELSLARLGLCVVVGLAAGALAAAMSSTLYLVEDGFHKLPFHWMWWPALGGLAVGVGGYIFPPALGVGYDVIEQLLSTEVTMRVILGVLLVKSIIWLISLGSGTSGGVLAPLLMIGGALGALASHVLPYEGIGFWPMVSMGAVLAAAMNAPIMAILFAFELTYDPSVLLPLLVAGMTAHALTVLVMQRSILTEKLSRRGHHLTREYSVDPLETAFVRDVMRTGVATIAADDEIARAKERVPATAALQSLLPVVDGEGRLVGMLDLQDTELWSGESERKHVRELIDEPAIVAFTNEPLSVVAYRMAANSLSAIPVLDSNKKFVAMVALGDLLKARSTRLEAEFVRERVFGAK